MLARALPLAFFTHFFASALPSSLCISYAQAPHLCPHFTPYLPHRASSRVACLPVADYRTRHPSPCVPPSAPKPSHTRVAFPRLHPHSPRVLYLLTLARVSRCLYTAPQLVLYCTLEHPVTLPANADACVTNLATTSHLVELTTSLTVPTFPFSHGPSFNLALPLALP